MGRGSTVVAGTWSGAEEAIIFVEILSAAAAIPLRSGNDNVGILPIYKKKCQNLMLKPSNDPGSIKFFLI